MDNNNNNYYQNPEQQQPNDQQQQQSYYQPQQQQQSYYQPQQQSYYQPNQMPPAETEAPVSLGEWVITLIIMAIPCVNIIMMFVWGFGSGAKTSKKNYCRAMLIFLLIGIVFYFLVGALIIGSVLNILESFAYRFFSKIPD